MFGFLFLKSSDSGLKVKSSSWKTDTKTNVDSQTTLKPHNDMHEAILHHQLLLQKFIHNFLLGKMQMFFFYYHGITVGLWQIERSKPQPPEITIHSSAPPVSLASSPWLWTHALALMLLKQLVFLFGLCGFGALERWTLELLLWYRHQRG